MKRTNFVKSNKNLIICRDYRYSLFLFIYIFALYPRESSSLPFPCCTPESTRFSGLRYEQIMVAQQIVSKSSLSAKRRRQSVSDPFISIIFLNNDAIKRMYFI